MGTGQGEWWDLREALDQRELMFDLSTIGLGLLLGLVELLRRGVLFEGDLYHSRRRGTCRGANSLH